MTEPRRPLPHWISAPLCLAPVLIMTWPLPVALNWQLIDGFFQWGQVWGTGLVWDALSRGELPGLQTDWLDYPQGGVVVLIGWSTHLLACALNLFLPLLAAFNVAVLFHLWLATWAGTLLIQRITGDGWGGLAGGVLFGCGPMAQWALSHGQLDQYSHAWIALFLLALLAMLQRGGAIRTLLLGISCLGLLFSHPHGAVMTAPFALVLGLVELLRARPRRPVLMRGLQGAAACLLPALLAAWYFGNAERSLLAPPLKHSLRESVAGIMPSLVRVGDWSLNLTFIPHDQGRVIFTLGLVPLGLALLGLCSRRRRLVWLWGGIALAAAVLSLGRWAQLGGLTLPLPLVALASIFPPAARISDATRFAVLTQLALGVLMALGFSRLRGLLRGRALHAAWVASIALLLVEQLHPHGMEHDPGHLHDWDRRFMSGGVQTIVAPYPSVYALLAADPDAGALVEFPNQPGMSAAEMGELTQRQMFYQAFHRRPLGLLDKNNNHATWVMQQPVMGQLVNECREGPCEPGEHDAAAVGRIRDKGFTHLIFHQGWLEPEHEARCLAYLDLLYHRVSPADAEGPLLFEIR
jgi:hypothetical protein